MLSRRRRMTTPILAGVLGGLLTSVVIGNWQRTRPNVVMIVVDSMRGDSVSQVIGSANTPTLRALIAEGVQFPNAFTHSSQTVEAHVALQSGTLPYELGVARDPRDVHARIPLLAESLRDHGYQTAAAIGLGELFKPRAGEGLARGFQRYEHGEHSIEDAAATARRLSSILDGFDPNESFYLLADFADLQEPYGDGGVDEHSARALLDDRVVDELVISQNNFWSYQLQLTPGEHLFELSADVGIRVRQFELRGPGGELPYELRVGAFDGSAQRIVMVLTNPTDAPLAVELDAWIHDAPDLQELRQRYQHQIELVDQAIGELVADLKRRGLYEDTVLIVTSSHGSALGEHDVLGHDVNLFDEVLHVPLIVRLPKDWEQRALLIQNTPELVRLIDVAPTILELCEVPPWGGMAGASLLCEAKRPFRAQAVDPIRAIGAFAMRDLQYKLIYTPSSAGDTYELYRLSSDPLELDNVFSHQGDLRKEWQQELRSAAQALGAR